MRCNHGGSLNSDYDGKHRKLLESSESPCGERIKNKILHTYQSIICRLVLQKMSFFSPLFEQNKHWNIHWGNCAPPWWPTNVPIASVLSHRSLTLRGQRMNFSSEFKCPRNNRERLGSDSPQDVRSGNLFSMHGSGHSVAEGFGQVEHAASVSRPGIKWKPLISWPYWPISWIRNRKLLFNKGLTVSVSTALDLTHLTATLTLETWQKATRDIPGCRYSNACCEYSLHDVMAGGKMFECSLPVSFRWKHALHKMWSVPCMLLNISDPRKQIRTFSHHCFPHSFSSNDFFVFFWLCIFFRPKKLKHNIPRCHCHRDLKIYHHQQ